MIKHFLAQLLNDNKLSRFFLYGNLNKYAKIIIYFPNKYNINYKKEDALHPRPHTAPPQDKHKIIIYRTSGVLMGSKTNTE